MPRLYYGNIRAEKLWSQRSLDMGFLYCASGPLVRSSYKAGEAFIENVLKKRRSARHNESVAERSVLEAAEATG